MEGSITQGESVDKISKRLRDVTDMNKRVALRNARTMVNAAENSGLYEMYLEVEAMGIPIDKMWQATLDAKTRTSHVHLDGMKLPLKAKFPNGLLYPSDPDGEAGEVYNCRCRLSCQILGFERDMSDLSNRNTDHFNYDSYEEWKTGIASLYDTDTNAAKKYMNGSTRSRASVAKEALKIYGKENVPVAVVKLNSHGKTMTYYKKGKPAQVQSVLLDRDDARDLRYQVKTTYHEAFHAGVDGKPHDRGVLDISMWKSIEETMAETSAHYHMQQIGVTDLAASYSDTLFYILPRLKRVKGFKSCSTFADFGEKATVIRAKGNNANWTTLHNKVVAQKLPKGYYNQYLSVIEKDIKGYVAKLKENSPNMTVAYQELALDQAIKKVRKGVTPSSNEQKILKRAIVLAMNRVGVL